MPFTSFCSQVAEFVVELLKSRSGGQAVGGLQLRGVSFYDEAGRGWAVLELSGRCSPRHASPLREAETFALFDQVTDVLEQTQPTTRGPASGPHLAPRLASLQVQATDCMCF